MLGFNKNTGLRALHNLRNEGLLDFQRGRGITVAGTPQQGAVVAKVRELVEFCRLQGYQRDEVIRIIEGLPRRSPSGSDRRGQEPQQRVGSSYCPVSRL